MNDKTQLPADVLEEIKMKAEGYATITAHIPKGVPISHNDAHLWCRIDYEAGATEYATKLHQVQQEVERRNKLLESNHKLSMRLNMIGCSEAAQEESWQGYKRCHNL
jgi:hypothetical protein